MVAQKEEWQTLNHFGGSSVCLASRRFMRSGYFIDEAIWLHNNANTVERIRIFLYMPGIAVGSCGPPQQEKRKRLSVSFRTEIDPELAPNTYSAVFLSSFVREIRRKPSHTTPATSFAGIGVPHGIELRQSSLCHSASIFKGRKTVSIRDQGSFWSKW